MAAMRQSFDRTGNGVLCIRRRALVVDSLLEPLPELPPLVTLATEFAHPDLVELEAGLDAKQALLKRFEKEYLGKPPASRLRTTEV